MSAIIFSDEISEVLFIRSLISSWPGPVYHLEPGRRFSHQGTEEGRIVRFGRVYELSDVYEDMRTAGEGSLIIVGGAPLLGGLSPEAITSLRALSDRLELTVVLYHTPLTVNELDLAAEFRRYYQVPELMDYLMAMRTLSYRGHYRMSLRVLRVPYDFLSSLGDHVFSVDNVINSILG